MILLFPDRCQGCRICETACSIHHTGHREVNPLLSSTRVSRDNDTAQITMTINETCDMCKGEETPLCIIYCAYGARGIQK